MCPASLLPGRQVCVRCHSDLTDDTTAALSYRKGPARRWVCVNCLSWAEKDAFLSATPRQRASAERDGRFVSAEPSASAMATATARGAR